LHEAGFISRNRQIRKGLKSERYICCLKYVSGGKKSQKANLSRCTENQDIEESKGNHQSNPGDIENSQQNQGSPRCPDFRCPENQGTILAFSPSLPTTNTQTGKDDVCEEVVSTWNENRGALPEVIRLTEKRRDQILARIKSDTNFLENFRRAAIAASHTEFLVGGPDRHGWRASFDWLIENDTNYVRVLEDGYGKPVSSPERQGELGGTKRVDRLSSEIRERGERYARASREEAARREVELAAAAGGGVA